MSRRALRAVRLCRRVGGAALLVAWLLAGAAGAQEAAPDYSSLAVGVAPFEAVAPGGGDVPDVAAALTGGLEAIGLGTVVGPAALEFPGTAPGATALRDLAARNGVRAIVVGRTTRLGERYSVDVRLRSGLSGALVGTYVAELPAGEPLDPIVEGLANRIAQSLLELEETGGLAVSAAPPTPRAPAAPPAAPVRRAADGEGAPFGLWDFDSGEPLSIRADELDATDREGARTLRFRSNVEVEQGDLTLSADRLEASYESGAREPHRLVAEGGVRLQQADRGATCGRAVYERARDRILCTGDARLHDGRDTVTGDAIEFDLATERVFVRGGSRLTLEPEPKPAPQAGADGATALPAGQGGEDAFGFDRLDGEGPVAILSQQLMAEEQDGMRRILFEGGVELTQADLTLHSERLEAHYPEGARQPERLVASGEVRVRQGEREMNCDEAVYHHRDERLDCVGTALLREGDDEVRGERIEFDLASRTVVVTGRTRLRMNQGLGGAAEPPPQVVQ